MVKKKVFGGAAAAAAIPGALPQSWSVPPRIFSQYHPIELVPIV
jgi:hypothetical protein